MKKTAMEEASRPIKCPHCGSDDLYDDNYDIVAGVVWSHMVYCRACKQEVGYYERGMWHPGYEDDSEIS